VVQYSKLGRGMSALGQKRTLAPVYIMSALTLKAAILRAIRTDHDGVGFDDRGLLG